MSCEWNEETKMFTNDLPHDMKWHKVQTFIFLSDSKQWCITGYYCYKFNYLLLLLQVLLPVTTVITVSIFNTGNIVNTVNTVNMVHKEIKSWKVVKLNIVKTIYSRYSKASPLSKIYEKISFLRKTQQRIRLVCKNITKPPSP